MVAKVGGSYKKQEYSVLPNRRQKCCLFGNTIIRARLRKVVKKVVFQNIGNAPQKININVLLAKYLVNIRAGTAQAGCKPGDGATLFAECLFDKLPDMKHKNRRYT